MPKVADADLLIWKGESWTRRYPNRPFAMAADGLPAPTALEIEEGKAHKRWKARPDDKQRAEAWKELYIRLYKEEGDPATTRCSWCHVIRWGRPITAPCGHCGRKREPGDDPA